MHALDIAVLAGYFAIMIGIGIYCSRRIKAQEDYFMGGRSFGKLLQTFAAFGAGTGSSDPVNTGRTTFIGGMSGMWSVMFWLFVTPFYWITGVWYRRMRHLTLGDWFVERYESRNMGAAYAVFGLGFFMLYGAMLFAAIGAVAAPLIQTETFNLGGQPYPIEYLLVPIIGVVVLAYGMLGGLQAAYITDLIQGLCIVVLSVILIPYGLTAIVEKFGDPSIHSMIDGFRFMHEQLPKEQFSVIGSTSASEFPLHRIIAIVIINLVGVVVQPHFIATGGGSAKTETNARVGLVAGNFLKRFCTVGWALTALIALALYSDNRELIVDPSKTWGVASRELLGPGLTGLMLACLLAALMSSLDAYMIIGSGLVVRNLYAPYINAHATEKEYIRLGRITGLIVVGGAVLIALSEMDVFALLKKTWVFPVLFAAPFWIGMFWRRATTIASWVTVIFAILTFFVIPALAPMLIPGLATHASFLTTNDIVVTTTVRQAAPSDVARRTAQIAAWNEAKEQTDAITGEQSRIAALQQLGESPQPLQLGDNFPTISQTGGQAIFWTDGVQPVDDADNVLDEVKPQPIGLSRTVDANSSEVTLRYADGVQLKGFGDFKPNFLLYQWLNIDLTSKSNATLDTLDLPPKIVTPFLVMILISLITSPNSQQALDRYFAKMKTQVDPDPDKDRLNLEAAYANPAQCEQKKLFPGSSLEFQKPTVTDVVGFILCFVACFAIIGIAIVLANVGG